MSARESSVVFLCVVLGGSVALIQRIPPPLEGGILKGVIYLGLLILIGLSWMSGYCRGLSGFESED